MKDITESLVANVLTAQLTICGESWGSAGKVIFNDPFGRIYYLRKGSASVEHHGRRYELRPGFLYLIPAHSPGRYVCPERMELLWCHFTAKIFGEIDLFDYYACEHEVRIPQPEKENMQEMWKRLTDISSAGTAAAHVESSGILKIFISRFLATADESQSRKKSESWNRFKPTLEFIDRNISRQIRIPELAKIAGFQENYFTNIFHSTFGTPPLDYINSMRMRKAGNMLRSGSKSLKEISSECGFCDQFHFSTVFRRRMGMTPSQFRKSLSLENS
jgi:AraC family transcriptional regulator